MKTFLTTEKIKKPRIIKKYPVTVHRKKNKKYSQLSHHKFQNPLKYLKFIFKGTIKLISQRTN